MDLGFSESTDHDYPNWLIGFGFLERERERERVKKSGIVLCVLFQEKEK